MLIFMPNINSFVLKWVLTALVLLVASGCTSYGVIKNAPKSDADTSNTAVADTVDQDTSSEGRLTEEEDSLDYGH